MAMPSEGTGLYPPKDYATLPDIPNGLRGDVERVSAYLYKYQYPESPSWAHLPEDEKAAWRHLARFVIDGK